MIRMSILNKEQIKNIKITSKNNDILELEIFEKEGNIYIGPSTMLFNTLFEDTNRVRFESKIDKKGNELLHVSTILKYIDKFENYSLITRESLISSLVENGYDINDLTIKEKVYSASKEMMIKYGFSDTEFTKDLKGNIWMFLRSFELNKLKNEIADNLPKHKIKIFRRDFKKMIRYIRYIDTKSIQEDGKVRAFVYKSVNITELYKWLNENKSLHLVDYVADLYNLAIREADFEEYYPDKYYRVVCTENGLFIKKTSCK